MTLDCHFCQSSLHILIAIRLYLVDSSVYAHFGAKEKICRTG